MFSPKEELLRRAEKHEESAKQLRFMAAGKYIDDSGEEFAKIDNGVLSFVGRSPKLKLDEWDRFATWLRRMKRL